ncbi:MAG TPA: hypothetical protein PKD00_00275 [Burkholderiales bacterium]|nr:hypothetical protein [Burkholderiales bacterium]
MLAAKCVNFNIPFNKQLLYLYGKNTATELSSFINSKEFINWYGSNSYPMIINHAVFNSKGEKLDLRSKIIYTKTIYENRLNNIINDNYDSFDLDLKKYLNPEFSNYSSLKKGIINGKYINKKIGAFNKLFNSNVKKLDLSLVNTSMDSQTIVNILLSDYLDKIKNKYNKTLTEKNILNNVEDINKFFGLKDIKFEISGNILENDSYFEILQKIKSFIPESYVNYLKNNTNIDNVYYVNNIDKSVIKVNNDLYINKNIANFENLSFIKDFLKILVLDNFNISDESLAAINTYLPQFDKTKFKAYLTNKDLLKSGIFENDEFVQSLRDNSLYDIIDPDNYINELLITDKTFPDKEIYIDFQIIQNKKEQCLL